MYIEAIKTDLNSVKQEYAQFHLVLMYFPAEISRAEKQPS